MINWDQFVTEHICTDEIRLQLIADYEQLRENGEIGDCLLRSIAQLWAANIGFNGGITSTMFAFANECYMTFAHRWIKENGK